MKQIIRNSRMVIIVLKVTIFKIKQYLNACTCLFLKCLPYSHEKFVKIYFWKKKEKRKMRVFHLITKLSCNKQMNILSILLVFRIMQMTITFIILKETFVRYSFVITPPNIGRYVVNET